MRARSRTRPRLFASLPALVTLVASGCTCSGATGGAGDIVTCSAQDPRLSEPVVIGAATLTPSGHRLAISGLPPESRWVVGRGAALSIEPFAPTLDALEALQPHGVLVLGSLGRGERLAEFVEAMGTLEVPVLLVPGPRDRPTDLLEVLEAHPAPNVIPLVGVHVVELGAVALAIAAGGAAPRYVLDGACGVTRAELDEVLEAAADAEVRVLVGFDAPSGTPLTAGIDGAEAGSDLVRQAMDAAEVAAGIFAGPDANVGRPFDGAAPGQGPSRTLRLIVPPLAGPATESADGSRRAAGPTLLLLSSDGIRAVP